MQKKIVIGDIHGSLKALKQVLQKAGLKKEDQLIFLGDYVDGWSESAGVVSYLMELDEEYECIFLRGNHDAWCEEWLKSGATSDDWLYSGGFATIKSYEALGSEDRARHMEFYNRMLRFYQDDQNRLFIHAGFSSMHGPERDRYESNYYWDRSLWELALATDDRIPKESLRYPKRLKLYNEIYIGHTPTTHFDSAVPMHAANVWNLDTGAAFLGKLTALDIDTKEFWQSDTVQELYPGETGRNSTH